MVVEGEGADTVRRCVACDFFEAASERPTGTLPSTRLDGPADRQNPPSATTVRIIDPASKTSDKRDA